MFLFNEVSLAIDYENFVIIPVNFGKANHIYNSYLAYVNLTHISNIPYMLSILQ